MRFFFLAMPDRIGRPQPEDDMNEAAMKACEQIRELSGDVADTLAGSHGPGDAFAYRGTLLHELLEAALTVRQAYLAEHKTPQPTRPVYRGS